jgi:hypothetical protein
MTTCLAMSKRVDRMSAVGSLLASGTVTPSLPPTPEPLRYMASLGLRPESVATSSLAEACIYESQFRPRRYFGRCLCGGEGMVWEASEISMYGGRELDGWVSCP